MTKAKAYWKVFVHPTRQFMAGCCAGCGFGLMVGSGPSGSLIFALIGGGLIGVGGHMAVADQCPIRGDSSANDFTKS
jgi:hypothetical protein